MNFYDNASTCLECYTGIDRDVDAFSKRHFGAPLCVGCQQRLKREISDTVVNKTPELPGELQAKLGGVKISQAGIQFKWKAYKNG